MTKEAFEAISKLAMNRPFDFADTIRYICERAVKFAAFVVRQVEEEIAK